MSTSETAELSHVLKTLNHTELYQTALRAGLRVLPSMEREALIAALLGTIEVDYQNPINDYRDGIMGAILEHWRKLQSQLMCPAKTGNPKACYQCVDAQVFHCLSINPSLEPRVLAYIRRKNDHE
jgi:hypothetical protein